LIDFFIVECSQPLDQSRWSGDCESLHVDGRCRQLGLHAEQAKLSLPLVFRDSDRLAFRSAETMIDDTVYCCHY